MNILSKILYKLKKIYRISSNDRFINYLKAEGVTIGKNVLFREPRTTAIDLSRPCLISIGSNVDINTHFTIMTHDFCNYVFRNAFSDYINSSGRVNIGSNIYFGRDVTILKGASVGNNCIIGAGSIITKDIPDNSVAVGAPCKVICSLEEYYERRKKESFAEAIEYIKLFRKKHGRNPKTNMELREEWVYFIDANNINNYPEIPVKQRVGVGFDKWLKEHKAPFHSYEEFMNSIE
ncbi:MAG: acyltransferase [Prevotella sp.]|nr:acyltransferase [Prevotellaceae bacterium]MDY3935563.1 acyltransferase [Prevotella sp.]